MASAENDAAQEGATAPPASARGGRGACSNAVGRFERLARERSIDAFSQADADAALEADRAALKTHVADEVARSVLTRNASPDVPFDRSVNPYRGCEHGCVYCFARPSHAYLGLSPGLDFETKLTAKPNAPEMLRKALSSRKYRPAPIAIGTNTDPYQPIERERRIMRGVLETLLEFRHPVTIVTKGALVLRDLDLLTALSELGLARVALSVTTLDPKLARDMEPRASTPTKRLKAIGALSAAGVPTGVMVAPVIPGLTDHEIEPILEAAANAGCLSASYVALRLPREVSELFQEWLAERRPERAAKVMRQVRELHGGRDYDPEWGRRMRGEGVVADLIARRFDAATRRLGLVRSRRDDASELRVDLFRRPPVDAGSSRQLDLPL